MLYITFDVVQSEITHNVVSLHS